MHSYSRNFLRLVFTGIAAAAFWTTLGTPASAAQPGHPALVAAPGAVAGRSDPSRCSALVGQRFAGAVVAKVDLAPTGSVLNLAGAKGASDICKVSARISPTADSEINFEVWLPASWNGKLLGIGGGGFHGALTITSLLAAVPANDGYAVVTTDAGHNVSNTPTFALGHPEKIVDFGYRANHLGAVVAKAIAAAYYGASPKRAYFHGCSNGGRDALMLAERHPEDYDAIAVGAPANDWTGLMAAFMQDEKVVRLATGADTLGPKLPLVHDAVLRKCGALDGIRDGLVSNPAICRFDPAILKCKRGVTSNCLSSQEVAAIRAIYHGTRGRDGRLIMPGFAPGSEYQWPRSFTSPQGATTGMGLDYYRYFVIGDPGWQRGQFQLDRDYALSKKRMGPFLDATDADLRPFVRRGGKLLMYHGWDDAAIPPANSIRYYEAARRILGARADRIQLFMIPGMAHCGEGNGPNVFDAVGMLDTRVDRGQAPSRLILTKYDDDAKSRFGLPGKVVRTRVACAWPKSPHYKGSGSADDAASFVCR